MAIQTDFTKMMGIDYPIIGAPMFLVSNEDMVVEVSEAGGIGSFPALNYRPPEHYHEILKRIKKRTKKPIGVNIIVNKGNKRQDLDLKYALEEGVDLFITSLGNPKEVIKQAHKNGAKVICDVTNLEHALKVQDMGADGVVAVSSGAGGHAGPTSPFVLVPWLKQKLSIPVVAAGGVADGRTMASALCLGASAVHVGTRFIASTEAQVGQDYKQAIVDSNPEDIVLTSRISGTPCSFINTDYVKKMGKDLPFVVEKLKKNKTAKKYIVPLIYYLGSKQLEESAQDSKDSKQVWCAGQSVGLIDEVLSCKEIVENIVREYTEAVQQLPKNI